MTTEKCTNTPELSREEWKELYQLNVISNSSSRFNWMSQDGEIAPVYEASTAEQKVTIDARTMFLLGAILEQNPTLFNDFNDWVFHGASELTLEDKLEMHLTVKRHNFAETFLAKVGFAKGIERINRINELAAEVIVDMLTNNLEDLDEASIKEEINYQLQSKVFLNDQEEVNITCK
ncbi:MAG: hypothetical protein ACPGTQ_10185 [Colwellia sp.]